MVVWIFYFSSSCSGDIYFHLKMLSDSRKLKQRKNSCGWINGGIIGWKITFNLLQFTHIFLIQKIVTVFTELMNKPALFKKWSEWLIKIQLVSRCKKWCVCFFFFAKYVHLFLFYFFVIDIKHFSADICYK